MGGLVTTVIKTSDNKVFSFKLNTAYWSRVFLSVNMLDEQYAIKEISKIKNLDIAKTKENHEEYSAGGCLRAPFEYGIVYINYIDKKIYSLNDYAPFSYLTSKLIMSGYNEFEEISVKEIEGCFIDNDYFRLIKFLQYDVEIKLKDKVIKEKNIEKIIAIIKKEVPIKKTKELTISGVSDVQICVNGWDIYEDGKNKEELTKMYDIFNKDFELTKEEKEIWKNEINQ